MSVANIETELESAQMGSALSFFNTPEGRTYGAGKTVGNGIEGWAPNALFVHTDGGAGVRAERVYLNTGTKAAAVWTRYQLSLDPIGYGIGAGGANTQATNKTTGVTLNTICGTITTNNAALAAGAEATFTVTNSNVQIPDVVILSIQSGGTSGEYLAHVTDVGTGSFDITLCNMSGSSASDAVLINFAVIKSVGAT